MNKKMFQKSAFFLLLGFLTVMPNIAILASDSKVSGQVKHTISNDALLYTNAPVLQAGVSAAIYLMTVEEPKSTALNRSTQGEESDHLDLVVLKSDIPVFMYRSNELSGDPVGMMSVGSAGELLAEGDTWCLVRSGSYTGFMDRNTVLVGTDAHTYADKHYNKEATVLPNTVFAYADRDMNSFAVTVLSKGERVAVEDMDNDICHIRVKGWDAYIERASVAVQTVYQTAEEPDFLLYGDLYPEQALTTYGSESAYEAAQVVSELTVNPDDICLDIMNEIVAYALKFLGRPYVWGGESLMYGCDCSGFVMKVYEHFGYSLPHSSAALRSVGYDVCGDSWDESLALPGDIICYDGHVGIYIGDGEMINAASKKSGIKISKVTARDDFICARRVVAGHDSKWNLTDQEYEELCRIVEAEAGGEEMRTRTAIADVVLNRVKSNRFPDNVHDVIFAENQFSPVSNGRYYKVTVSASTRQAVDTALQSPDRTMGALYFMNPHYSDSDNVKWFYGSLTYLFSMGDVEFFR